MTLKDGHEDVWAVNSREQELDGMKDQLVILASVGRRDRTYATVRPQYNYDRNCTYI